MRRLALVAMLGVSVAGAAVLVGVGAGELGSAPAMAQGAGGADACAGLQAQGLFKDTTVSSAKMVASDPAKKLPTYCEVTAVISPEARSHIGVVYRLPEGWNGKIVNSGGGGWAGNVSLFGAQDGLQHGYATGQTDGGHNSGSVWDTSWATNPAAVTDFAYRAMHLMTVTGKEVVAHYYGRHQKKTYYTGCSTGGRQGLMEVQRYPADYDAVSAGAPVYNLLVQTSAIVRDQTFGAPGAGVDEAQLKLINDAVLGACDAKDGVKDGILSDPRKCAWDPKAIQCKPGQSGDECLTEPQVNALRSVYAGVVLKNGQRASWPLEKGGEVGWSRFLQISAGKPDSTNGGGMGTLGKVITGDDNFSVDTFNAARDMSRIRDSDFAHQYEANDPKIAPFLKHGGKLLLWHGWSDPGPSPIGTITYFDKVRAANPNSGNSARLFLLPGVYHCGGGPGPDRMDQLSAIDKWSTTGKPPQVMEATKTNNPISRPICPYPTVATYKGRGDPNDTSSYVCKVG
ncbi:MAG TPA: tannase/feruloyl esterase family alpha/beta hydrolase [Caulobacteraceae bacterium]|nr:tannase/feruloyl esterase family alpha/beta hydrolase [Caulobacteraceae bacterium]